MRVFLASLSTETNCSSPFPTGLSAFEENGISRHASIKKDSYEGEVLAAIRGEAEGLGYEVIESITAFAQPGGRVVKSAYEKLRDTILYDLRGAGHVDLIFLLLHGAMVAVGYDDCELDIVEKVKDIAPNAIVGVELDLHCHLSSGLVRKADVVVTYKEYPHVDGSERARELFDLCRRKRVGEIHPIAALIDTRMIGFYPTFDRPMRQIVDRAIEIERNCEALSVSIAHGFPWADVADAGTRVLVYTDGDRRAAGDRALELADALYGHRAQLLPCYPGLEESLDRASSLQGRVVLGDHSDNPGGGAPGDSTFFLQAILDRGIPNVAIGCIFDPGVARMAADAGVGASLDVRLGGKVSSNSGQPIDLQVEVAGIASNHGQQCFEGRVAAGLTVWLKYGTINILVNDLRTQVYGTDLFTGIGVELRECRLIVVKSSSHFEYAFQSVADHMWRVSSPGALNLDLANFEFTKRDMDFFPRVPDPWHTVGRPSALIIEQE
jgi:microcystin degradation protein MlrC